MPTILNDQGFRFHFFSDEGSEPCHIHVKKGAGRGKIWMLPKLKEDYYYNFTAQEKRKIKRIIEENRGYIIEKWNEHFNR